MAEGEGNFGMNSVREYYLMHRHFNNFGVLRNC